MVDGVKGQVRLARGRVLVVSVLSVLALGALSVSFADHDPRQPNPPRPAPRATVASHLVYSEESPWNVAIPAGAVAVASLAKYLPDASRLTSDASQYTVAVWRARRVQDGDTVAVRRVFSDVIGPQTLVKSKGATTGPFAMPPELAAPAGTDGEIVLLDEAHGDEWGFWRFTRLPGGEYAAENGYHYNTRWSGVPPQGFGSRGAGIPYLAGLVMGAEKRKPIEHALAIGLPIVNCGYVAPATKSDGKLTVEHGLAEGTRLQLDPTLSDTELKKFRIHTATALAIAHAMQRYGLYVVDYSGRPKIYLESTLTAQWGQEVAPDTFSQIPLSAFHILAPGRISTDACAS